MVCLICDGPAATVDSLGDYEERACGDCGHYRVTRTAMMLLESNGWRFDVELTRNWIVSRQGTGEIPTINSNWASVMIAQ
ncbi:hypothetical protein HMPREF3173_10210 [Pseudomonas sp. HMSC08G10]|nr:hypothetical protein HMPREF3173_10210 [Pseudomonas sp. HMSC08G10]